MSRTTSVGNWSDVVCCTYVEFDILLNAVISVRSKSKTFAYFKSHIRTKGCDWWGGGVLRETEIIPWSIIVIILTLHIGIKLVAFFFACYEIILF